MCLFLRQMCKTHQVQMEKQKEKVSAVPDDKFCFFTLKKILAPHWSTSVANCSDGQMLKKRPKFCKRVKDQNISRVELLCWFISHRAAGVYIVLQD